MIEIWSQASLALRKAEEVIVIGYSMPPEDSAVVSLFAGVDFRNKTVRLIDPKANELKDRYSRILQTQKIEAHPITLKAYLEARKTAE